MNPILVAIAGPLKSAVVSLAGPVSIGREASNQIVIKDVGLSRRHCEIAPVPDGFLVRDLGSRNGTFVNELPVQERVLATGDRITVGNSIFLFLLQEADDVAGEQVLWSDEDLVASQTMQIPREAIPLLTAQVPASERASKDLSALLKISATVQGLRDPIELPRQLLEQILPVVPAEYGVLLLLGRDEQEFESVSSVDRRKAAGQPLPVLVSRTIARHVLEQGVALLSNDALEERSFAEAESLVGAGTGSILAVPLLFAEQRLGVLYFATSNPLLRFDEDHLQLVTAAAAMIAPVLERMRYVEWLESENTRLQAEIDLTHNMIGESDRMRDLYARLQRVAPTDTTVLIRGESGTGKELAARAIHQNSARAARPFVAINCAALTETLLESELFGHEKGAFTGAVAQKKGKLEVAQGGTLFLDEIGELAPALQAKLLRVLQEREYERVGGIRPLKADIRLLAATNRNLEEAMKRGEFRQDLYYRLNVVTLTMPPLRERREDIPLLASYFARVYAQKCKRQVRGFSREARACLLGYDWPGNVRELENAVERAVVLGIDEIIQPEDLPEFLAESAPALDAPVARYHEAVKEAKKAAILQALEQAEGSYTQAAKLLGVNPTYLHRVMRNLNLKPLIDK